MSWRTDAECADGQAAEPRPADPVDPLEPEGRWESVTPWAELHCHSAFSFLDGAATPDELVAEAARLGLETLAITDHDGMYGVPQFAQAAARLRGHGVKLWCWPGTRKGTGGCAP